MKSNMNRRREEKNRGKTTEEKKEAKSRLNGKKQGYERSD